MHVYQGKIDQLIAINKRMLSSSLIKQIESDSQLFLFISKQITEVLVSIWSILKNITAFFPPLSQWVMGNFNIAPIDFGT